MAETKAEAETVFDAFIETYAVKYDKAVECLKKDRQALLAFYEFPAEHWKHLRTTNPIETPSRPCGTGRSDRRDASRTRPRSPWCSSWSRARRRVGAVSMATTSCQKSSKVRSSSTGSRSPPSRPTLRPKPPPPDPSGRHQKSAIARGPKVTIIQV
jgi:Transposase, Mutator family